MASENIPQKEPSHNGDYYINHYSCGVISGFIKDKPIAQMEANNKAMISDLKQKGYSVAKMEGSFVESSDTDHSDIISLFVVNQKVSGDDGGQLEQDLTELGRLYGQEYILSIREGISYLIDIPVKPRLGEKICIGTAHYGTVPGKHVFKVKGRPFGFK